jgi:hypothetical protein
MLYSDGTTAEEMWAFVRTKGFPLVPSQRTLVLAEGADSRLTFANRKGAGFGRKPATCAGDTSRLRLLVENSSSGAGADLGARGGQRRYCAGDMMR